MTTLPSSPATPFQTNRLLHGGDYNPEQWEHVPGIWDADVRLMGEANCNVVSVGIFSWARLEPEEGRYDTAWLDDIIGKLSAGGVSVFLATPSGAKPNWLALKYPEVRRVRANGSREPQETRHNHCPSSPVYRDKVQRINTMLATRYGSNPAVKLWHLSNEYGGECFCDLCFANFHAWLKIKYATIDSLNDAWWSRFWSHTYASFDEITTVDGSVHGLTLDWKRFTTDQCIDFMRAEIAPLKKIAPHVPVTTNMMGTYPHLDYWRFVKDLDVVSWDLYPAWGIGSDVDTACQIGFIDEMYRCMKPGRPWLQMEAVTGAVNWQPTPRPKRPGMHTLSSWHSVAHGADSVCYFQWRKSRGSSEKFHGAVVDHVGHGETRIFREVATLGRELELAAGIAGTTTPTEVAIIFDWVNRWAIEAAQGPRNRERNYEETCVAHYRPFWDLGIAADVFDGEQDFSEKRLLICPMLYLLKPGCAARIRAFVAAGGTVVMSYLSGITDENDLVHLGGWPGEGLREVFGIWVEEHDCLVDSDRQTIVASANAPWGLQGSYPVREYAEVVHAEGAEVLATFGEDFYAGAPAITRNRFGNGQAIYIAGRSDAALLSTVARGLADELQLHRALPQIPAGVCVRERLSAAERFLFVLNFSRDEATIQIGPGWTSVIHGNAEAESITFGVHGHAILRRSR